MRTIPDDQITITRARGNWESIEENKKGRVFPGLSANQRDSSKQEDSTGFCGRKNYFHGRKKSGLQFENIAFAGVLRFKLAKLAKWPTLANLKLTPMSAFWDHAGMNNPDEKCGWKVIADGEARQDLDVMADSIEDAVRLVKDAMQAGYTRISLFQEDRALQGECLNARNIEIIGDPGHRQVVVRPG